MQAKRTGAGQQQQDTAKAGGMPDKLKVARDTQVQATQLLATLLKAGGSESGVRKAAQDNMDSLSEQFFIMASTYLQMAVKEGNQEVIDKMEHVLKIAMEEKQKTLRPEIQLLNRLMAAQTADARAEVLSSSEACETLTMNNRYFFNLLDKFTSDVQRQAEGASKAALLASLQNIKKLALARTSS